ncbi:hypothetical protein [Xanthomonas fragariae]|uniref:hypothetical protein n=1 Tax=Xanthomonas fragariae TaxID=48664 RepID=UPI001ABDA4FC|nr:hypothetical protein [Xanthomonas fragariae]UKR52810.1 hypothetical protein K4A87_01385 [Xanthomonas fragariae]
MKKRINRHFIRRKIGFAIVGSALGLALANASMAQPKASQKATSKPAWPNNGIAQRTFPHGSIMFVEKENGKWHAWILELKKGDYVQAIDFFSGNQMRVKVKLMEDGTQDFAFTDASGKIHAGEDNGLSFKGPSRNSSMGYYTFDGPSLNLQAGNPSCDVYLNAINSPDEAPNKWSKVLIYHASPVKTGCPSGRFKSLINTALDLEDGTFLVTQGCWVFRLHKSDLSPVGSAPSLHIIDTDTLKTAINQAKGNNIQDASLYLANALHLSTTSEVSCRED